MNKSIDSIEDAYDFSESISDNTLRNIILEDSKVNKDDYEILESNGKYLSFLKNKDGSLVFIDEIEFNDEEKQAYGFDQPVGPSFAMGSPIPVGSYGFSKEGIKNFLVDAGKETIKNLMQIGKSSIDYLAAEPGEIGDLLKDLSNWAKQNQGKDINLSEEQLSNIGENVFELGGFPLVNTESLINALDQFPNTDEVKKFTNTVITDLFSNTPIKEKVNKFIATQGERKAADTLGLVASFGPLTSVLGKGAKAIKQKILPERK